MIYLKFKTAFELGLDDSRESQAERLKLEEN